MSVRTHSSVWREFVEARVPGYLRQTIPKKSEETLDGFLVSMVN